MVLWLGVNERGGGGLMISQYFSKASFLKMNLRPTFPKAQRNVTTPSLPPI